MSSYSLEQQTYEYQGTLCENGLLVCDLDGNGDDDIVICTLDGTLTIFKSGHPQTPWISFKNIGTVTFMCFGTISSSQAPLTQSSPHAEIDGIPLLFAVTGEGQLLVFHFRNDECKQASLTIPPNCTALALADVNDNGRNDIVLGFHNGAIKMFHIHTQSPGNDVSDLILDSSAYWMHTLPAQTWSFNQIHSSLLVSMGLSSLLIEPDRNAYTSLINDSLGSEDGVHGTMVITHHSFTGGFIIVMYFSNGKLRVLDSSLDVIKDVKLEVNSMFGRFLWLGDDQLYLVFAAWDGSTVVINYESWKVWAYDFEQDILAFQICNSQEKDNIIPIEMIFITTNHKIIRISQFRFPSMRNEKVQNVLNDPSFREFLCRINPSLSETATVSVDSASDTLSTILM